MRLAARWHRLRRRRRRCAVPCPSAPASCGRTPAARSAAAAISSAPTCERDADVVGSTRRARSWRQDTKAVDPGRHGVAVAAERGRRELGRARRRCPAPSSAARHRAASSSLRQRSMTRSMSCPSAKQCGLRPRSASPATRLTGKRPPSTAGRTASMTARTRPSTAVGDASWAMARRLVLSGIGRRASRNRVESGGSVRRQRMHAAVRAHRRRLDAAEVAPARAAVVAGVAVEDLAPAPGARHAEQVVGARHRREVADDQQRRAPSRGLRRKASTLRSASSARRPTRSRRRRSRAGAAPARAVDAVEVRHQALHACMAVERSSDPPFELVVVVHSRRWPNSPPMKSSFLPGCAHM